MMFSSESVVVLSIENSVLGEVPLTPKCFLRDFELLKPDELLV
jgi:hypothetical protein